MGCLYPTKRLLRLQLIILSSQRKTHSILPTCKHSPDRDGLCEQQFISYVNTKNLVESWIASVNYTFCQQGLHILPEEQEKVPACKEQYFE